jgi:hypothetical protein
MRLAGNGLVRWLCLACALCLLFCGAVQAEPGQDIYRLGRLPNGASLRGERVAGVGVEGLAGACITCHRGSGLGSSEGRIVIPPIIGKYLFRAHATNVQDVSLPHVPGFRSTREPYTDSSLARVIREGVGPNGRTLSDLMPRFQLDDAGMAALIAYLRQLGAGSVLGVTDAVLHFATIITPDADPQKRRAMLDVMQRFFDDKNEFIRGGIRPMQASREVEYRVSRRWQLHVWDLVGAPETWEAQLRQHQADEPVLAVVSGLGYRTWAPVHHFCQAAHLPCLLPNVELPVVAEGDFYPVYFSRGVLLEADLLRQPLLAERASGSLRRVVQIYRQGDIGEAAAAQLQQGLQAEGITVLNRVLDAAAAPQPSLARALQGLGAHDSLVLWLRASDLAALPMQAPPLGTLLLSGLMGGLEHAPLPASWRAQAAMGYPLDLPEQRKIRMNYPLSWFKIRHIEVRDERLQTDTYVACGILAETLTEMLDSFVPDYLVERLEVMVSHRLVNGYYPRLGLGQGQRFASKGGYIARFADSDGLRVFADGDWFVP